VLELVRAEFADRTWQAFWQTAVDHQRGVDVAKSLGMTVDAVYQAKSRVLRRVRELLRDAEEADA
jgi:RNA polymerase sigma-70 factor (ECF subfamily)